MKPKHNTFRRLALSTAIVVVAGQSTQAAPYTWTKDSAATQDWTTAGNWDVNGVFATGSGSNLSFFADTITALINGTNNIATSVPTALTMNVLTLNGKGAAATAASAITIASSGSTWTLDGTTPTVNLNGVNGSQALNYTIAAKLALAQADTLFTGDGSASFNFSGVISGTGKSITKTGTSALTLSGVNTFDGGIKLKAGSVKIDTNNAALGTGAFQIGDTTGTTAVTVDSLTARSITNALNIYQDFTYSGTNTLTQGTGAIMLLTNGTTGNRQITVSGSTLNLGGNIGDGGNSYGITKAGTGALILSGMNNYTGTTTISAGTLVFVKTASLYSGTTGDWTAANIKVGNTGALALNVGGTGEFTTGNVTTLLTNLGGANGTSTTGFATGSSIGFDTTNASGGVFTVADNMSNSTGAGGGAMGLVKIGANTLVLSGSNTFSGGISFVGSAANNFLVLKKSDSAGTGSINLYGGSGSIRLDNTSTGANILFSNTISLMSGSSASAPIIVNVAGDNKITSGLGINTGGSQTAVQVDGGTLKISGNWGNSTTGRNVYLQGAGNGTYSGILQFGNNVLNKAGAGTWTLTKANTYTGATNVSAGTLLVDGSTSTSSAVTIAAGTVTSTPVAKLGGKGTIGGNVSLTAESASNFKNGGVLIPTAAASGTKLSVTGTTTFGTGSIFEWNMSATTPATDPGNGAANSGSYGQLAGTGTISGGSAVFKIVLGSGNTFADAFWNTDKTWNNILTGAGATINLASIFSSMSGSGITFASGQGTVTGEGYFTFSGTSTLNWTAVPEPTSALAGLLITAGLLRRRRAA